MQLRICTKLDISTKKNRKLSCSTQKNSTDQKFVVYYLHFGCFVVVLCIFSPVFLYFSGLTESVASSLSSFLPECCPNKPMLWARTLLSPWVLNLSLNPMKIILATAALMKSKV